MRACGAPVRRACRPGPWGGKPPSEAPPTPQPTEKRWTISAADFGDNAHLLTNRSVPYAWERLTGENVRVSIGGRELPFTSTSAKPVFASDLSGAEWTVAAEVRRGEVVLVLTAPDQSVAGDTVASVTITNPGRGYTADPTVTFAAPPPGGTTATGTAARSGSVGSVTMTTAGSGYTAVPTVTFGAAPSGATATGAAVGSGYVDSVTVETAGSGYTSVPKRDVFGRRWGQRCGRHRGAAKRRRVSDDHEPGNFYNSDPTVTFGAAPSGGTTAAGTATRLSEVGVVPIANGGSGYTSHPTVTFGAPPAGGTRATGTAAISSGQVSSITMTNRGSGYTSAPSVTFSGGGGSGAAASANLQTSRIDAVTITNPGSGYTVAPSVTFSAAQFPAFTATGTAVLRYGVASVRVTEGGSGYTTAPTVTFGAAPSGGTTAAGTAVLRIGVASVTITNGGRGYPAAPTVTFSAPPSGIRAAGTANLAESGYDQYQNLYWARQTLAGKQLLVQLAD